MANTLAAQMTKLDAGTTPDPGFVDGTVRVFAETITFASQASGDTIEIGRLPKGAVVLYGVLTTGTSTGTATVSIGISGTAAKYKAATVHTSTDAPAVFGKAAALHSGLTAEETVIATVGTAALPSSGTMQVALVYAFN
jgi:hypothetical protein